MKNFDKAFEEVIGIEGGYANDPTDMGGETKYGISKNAFPYLDIKKLTLEKAKSIYKKNYWDNQYLNLDQIKDYEVQLEIFDTAINMGVGTAAVIFQKSLNILNRNERDFKDIKIDGWLGSKTFEAYKKVNKKTFIKVLNGFQFMRYVNIAERSPIQERFFNGWMKRV